MNRYLTWIDDNLLFILSLFLLAFIPLFPKWPLLDVLPGYIVRIRLEDFFVLFTAFIWFIYLLRGKINLKEIPLFKPILIYVAIGLLSTLSAILITRTVNHDLYQILKVSLHFFRRIEYFSLFFICFTAMYGKKQIKTYIWVIVTVVIGVTIYGFGQKYLYWPAYSTMNREFSKGIVLYLTEHARVLSTFGGHYDLAAYVMMTLTLLVVLMLTIKNKLLALGLFILALAEFWLLILTASRTSFIGFEAAIAVAFFILAFKKGWLWAGSRWVVSLLITMTIMLTVGPLSERFSQVIKLDDFKNKINSAVKAPPKNGIALRDDIPFEDQLKIVASESDMPPTPVNPEENQRPEDVYGDDPYASIATDSADASSSAKHADYSDNALKYGLSAGIRMDELWPNAIKAFKTNPLLGTGYSTLVKKNVWEQTPAESTDNDYLRMLGETGLLGLLSFFLILGVCVYTLWKAFKSSSDIFNSALFAVGIAMIVGLVVNAMYIDIFESSKVAYSFWSFMGILLALAVTQIKEKSDKEASKNEKE